MTNSAPVAYSVLESRLSPARMATYLAAADGDQAKALRLYDWNLQVSGALYEAIAVAEIVLRNAIHDEIARWHAEAGLHGSWLDDPMGLLEARARADIGKARERAEQRRKRRGIMQPTRPNPPVGAIIAELSFGFWRFLLAKRYEHTLWLNAIRHGFPGAHSRDDLEGPVRRLHNVRNRIAHLEPLLTRDLDRDEKDVDRVIRAVCPETAGWAAARRRIKAVQALRP